MTHEELKKAYELALQKCSELEKKIEEKDLRIEHLTELVLKRNKMLFGQKSEKAKFINDGQLAFEGIFNEAEAESDNSAPEPTTDTVFKKQGKTGQHRGRKEIRADLETKKIVYELPQEQQMRYYLNEEIQQISCKSRHYKQPLHSQKKTAYSHIPLYLQLPRA